MTRTYFELEVPQLSSDRRTANFLKLLPSIVTPLLITVYLLFWSAYLACSFYFFFFFPSFLLSPPSFPIHLPCLSFSLLPPLPPLRPALPNLLFFLSFFQFSLPPPILSLLSFLSLLPLSRLLTHPPLFFSFSSSASFASSVLQGNCSYLCSLPAPLPPYLFSFYMPFTRGLHLVPFLSL